METTKEQRLTWASVAAFGDFQGTWRHKANRAVKRLCQDVDALETALEYILLKTACGASVQEIANIVGAVLKPEGD